MLLSTVGLSPWYIRLNKVSAPPCLLYEYSLCFFVAKWGRVASPLRTGVSLHARAHGCVHACMYTYARTRAAQLNFSFCQFMRWYTKRTIGTESQTHYYNGINIHYVTLLTNKEHNNI